MSVVALGLAAVASGAEPACAQPDKALAPIPPKTVALMTAKGTSPAAPLVIRTYKKEAELEIWKQNAQGRFVYVKTFPICRWSGQLGPKVYPGDRQTPEGFYSVGPQQMNPNSHYYLSFDTGFPNAYDKAHGASGSALMVHGICSSMGCYAMTDAGVGEIYAIAREALKGGQPAFQLQAFPFHMSARNLALYRNDTNIDFWRQLKEGSDRFEATGEIVGWHVTNGRYVFEPSRDPAREAAARSFHAAETAKVAELVREGSAAILTTYADGGQNAIFKALSNKGMDLGTVSRPEALAYAGIDVTLVPARRSRPAVPPGPLVVDVADWRPEPALPAATLVRVRDAPLPDDWRVALVERPFHYDLYRAPAAPMLIAGAMPMRAGAMAR